MSVVPENLAEALSSRYRVERELGRGGMATVYLAEDLKHGRRVAIKVLDPAVAAAIGPERFLREIEIAARLTHPHILPLHDSGVAGDRLYYVTPYIEGESLRLRLERERQLPLEDALRLAREIASALGYAHHRGVVHRDIKPDNVLLSDGIALVADFGIARILDRRGETQLTTVGDTLGTPAYMAPEQILGGADVDGRADLYSLGCVLYEMLAGVGPFIGPRESLAHQHLSVAPRRVTETRPTVPPGVAAAIAKALAKLPADRHPTAERFVEALALGALEAPTPRPAAEEIRSAHNLPRQRSRFIGRARELAECARLIAEARLLTLTGIGGCGKTRLAVQLAENLLAECPDGVWFVDLAPVSEGSLVVEVVAGVLGVREEVGKKLLPLLARHVTGRRMLLVLDNCEHVLEACAELADELMQGSDAVRVLATSLEGLGVEGERRFALRSLGVPGAEDAGDPRTVGASEAVQLFVDRARSAISDFQLDAGNVQAVADICRRLDGIPLAIELAAARVKILSPEQIRARLDDRFRLLTGGSRSGLARHQALRATLQWSHDLLTPGEQRLFRRLAVFAGGWSLEAATRVAGEEADAFEIVDLLGRLVDKSLVVVERRAGGDPRYGLLETVRQYGLERLVESGEGEEARRLHLEEFASLAERAYRERAEHEESWAAVLETEHDNLRAALEVGRAGNPERYLELAGSLGWFWYVRSHLTEGREHVTAALASSPAAPPRATRARAIWADAHLASWQGAGVGAIERMEEAIGIWRELGDDAEVATALEGLGWATILAGRDEPALAAFAESLELQRRHGDPVLIHRAMVGVAQTLVALHRVGEARELSERIIAFARPRGDRRTEHFGLHFLADCALVEDDCGEALGLYRQSLDLARAVKDRVETSFELEGVAMSLAGLGDAERALRFAGAVEAEWQRLGVELEIRFWSELRDRYLGTARDALGTEGAERAWNEGRKTSFEDAVTMALQVPGKEDPR